MLIIRMIHMPNAHHSDDSYAHFISVQSNKHNIKFTDKHDQSREHKDLRKFWGQEKHKQLLINTHTSKKKIILEIKEKQ